MFSKGKITLSPDLRKTGTLLQDLLTYIYHNIELDYDKLSKRLDYDPNDSDSDFDHYGPYGCKFDYKPGSSDCRFSYKINKVYDDCLDESSPNHELFESLHTYVRTHGARKIKFTGISNLTINNKRGPNTDPRGTRGLDWLLVFHPTFTVSRPRCISLHDLIIGCYKTKSHKFENNYEAVFGPKKIVLDGDSLEFNLDVDHGS